MSGITGLGTTFNLPNYHGELTAITPEDTPLLSAAGGLAGGGKQATEVSFEWQEFDLRDPRIQSRLEGGDAPNPEARVRANKDNVVQIFHESVSTSYTKQAAVDQSPSALAGTNPITNEHAWQVTQSLKQIARDVNYAFWHAKYNKPADNTTARQTRGLFQAITSTKQYVGDAVEITGASAATDSVTITHALAVGDKVVFTDVGASTTISPHRAYWVTSVSTTASFKVSAIKGGAAIAIGTATVAFVPVKATALLTPDLIGNLLQSVYENGGISEQGTATIFVPPGQKRAVTRAYSAANVGAQQLVGTRNVGGLNVDTVITDFGTLNIAIDKALPADALSVLSLEQISPVFLSIPGKGVLFEEELAKTGASEKTQIYGEIGLAYGNERAHGVLRGLFA
ncbi:hypothetical protein B2J88_08035 [Rhodococcus sp. SRB_17]|nr:hypothetical protein [Rhodococcus sp. SRB_17]